MAEFMGTGRSDKTSHQLMFRTLQQLPRLESMLTTESWGSILIPAASRRIRNESEGSDGCRLKVSLRSGGLTVDFIPGEVRENSPGRKNCRLYPSLRSKKPNIIITSS